MTVSDSSTATRVCPKCNQEKPLTREFWFTEIRENRKPFKTCGCRVCMNIARRESGKEYVKARRSTEEGRLAQNAAIRKWKAANPEKRREERRKYAAKQEKIYRYKQQAIERAYDRVIEQNARDAFKWWFSKKTDAQVAQWYEATDKPWLNPRLTPAEKDKVRHKFNNEYHIKRRLYYRDRKTKRRFYVKAANDGTLNPQIIKQATHCLYCGDAFSATCKPTLDHLVSIKKGGSHSAANAKVSGAGTASAGLPGYTAGDNTE